MAYFPFRATRALNHMQARKNLGDLAGKSSRRMFAGAVAQRQAADQALVKLPSLQSKLDSALMQAENAVQTAASQLDTVRNALENSSSGYALISRLDRPSELVAGLQEQLETLRNASTAQYPGSIREGGQGGEQDVVDVLNAETKMNEAINKVRPLITQVNSVMGQIKSVAAQAQAAIQKEQQAAIAAQRAEQAAALAQQRAEQAQIDAENRIIAQQQARENAQAAAEQARLNAQIQLEQQRAALEQQAALAPIQAQLQQQQAQQQAELQRQQQQMQMEMQLAQQQAQMQAQQQAQAAYLAQQQQAAYTPAYQPPVVTGQPQGNYNANYAELPGGYQPQGAQTYFAQPQPQYLPQGWTGQEAAARQAQAGPAPVDAAPPQAGGFQNSWYTPGFELFGLPGGMGGLGGLGATPASANAAAAMPVNASGNKYIPTAAQVQNLINAASPLIPGARQPAPEPVQEDTGMSYGSLAIGALAAWLLPKVIAAASKKRK